MQGEVGRFTWPARIRVVVRPRVWARRIGRGERSDIVRFLRKVVWSLIWLFEIRSYYIFKVVDFEASLLEFMYVCRQVVY